MQPKHRTALIAAAIAAAAATIALGPLNPPAGPVTETTPSLADLKADLDTLILNQTGTTDISGPYESFRTPAIGNLQDNLAGSLIAEGRVYVHSITTTFCIAAVFDGPGSIDSSGRAISGEWIGRSYHGYVIGGSSFGLQYTTVTTPVEQIVEGGLHAAWSLYNNAGFVRITYKRLPDLAAAGATE